MSYPWPKYEPLASTGVGLARASDWRASEGPVPSFCGARHLKLTAKTGGRSPSPPISGIPFASVDVEVPRTEKIEFDSFGIPELPDGVSFVDLTVSPNLRPVNYPVRRSPRLVEKPVKPEKVKKAKKAKDKPVAEPVPKKKKKPATTPRKRPGQKEITELRQAADLLESTNKKLRKKIWALENEVTSLKAQIMTNMDEVASAEEIEAELDHARCYIRALKAQVRALGGFAMSGGDESSGEDGENEEDGELPACFPKAAANVSEYSLVGIKQRRALRRKLRI